MRLLMGRALVAVAFLLTLGTAGCTGGSSSGDAKPSPSATFPHRDVSAQYLTAPAPSPTPIAGADGRIAVLGHKEITARFDVLSLTVRGGSTVLRARLSSSSDDEPAAGALSAGSDSERLSGVTLVTGDQRFRPATEAIGTAKQQQEYSPRCACGSTPAALGHGGVEVSVQYGALPAGVTTVSLRAHGFPSFDVPVTRGP